MAIDEELERELLKEFEEELQKHLEGGARVPDDAGVFGAHHDARGGGHGAPDTGDSGQGRLARGGFSPLGSVRIARRRSACTV